MNFLQNLKILTSNAHNRIEKFLLFQKIISKEITLDEYKLLLDLLYRFIHPCETLIKQRHLPLILGREKSPLLVQDMSQLQCYQTANFTFCSKLPDIQGDVRIYGYLYVMEGASLGGQIISTCLKENPQLPDLLPTRYFNPYGKETKKKWNEFFHSLIRKNFNQSQQKQVIDTAIDTFTTLVTWLEMSQSEST